MGIATAGPNAEMISHWNEQTGPKAGWMATAFAL